MPPSDLALDHHRVDQRAAILDRDIVQDLDFANAGIDRDHHGVRRIAEGAGVTLGLEGDRGLKAAAIDIRWQLLRAQIPGFGDITQRD